ncbi:MAG: glycine cleavage system protein GcvH [Deltaproteobacteria bacterium]|nr:glycine cleavage system protein GcvH [Deltaproteobacteria bacterium]
MEFPKDLRYSKTHEWIRYTEGKARIGISAFAVSAEQLGDITLVELPEVGQSFAANEPFGNIESVKSVSEIYAPFAGKVVAINAELDDSPELLNESPYEGGWLLEMEPDDAADMENLLDAAAYTALVASEA